MHKPLAGRNIAILIGNGFDEIQMTDGQRALLAAGSTPKIVSTASGLVNGWQGNGWGHYYPVDMQVGETLAADFDMLFLPGGERSVTKLLETAHTLRIVRGFRDGNKPIAAIGSSVELLMTAQRLAGATVSVAENLREKAIAADAKISDEDLSIDGCLMTANDTVEIARFTQKMIELFTTDLSLQSAA